MSAFPTYRVLPFSTVDVEASAISHLAHCPHDHQDRHGIVPMKFNLTGYQCLGCARRFTPAQVVAIFRAHKHAELAFEVAATRVRRDPQGINVPDVVFSIETAFQVLARYADEFGVDL